MDDEGVGIAPSPKVSYRCEIDRRSIRNTNVLDLYSFYVGFTLPDSMPLPRAPVLSAEVVFLSAEPLPRGSSRQRPLDSAQPAKAPLPRATPDPLGAHVPRAQMALGRENFTN
jgi:hypothetical protein